MLFKTYLAHLIKKYFLLFLFIEQSLQSAPQQFFFSLNQIHLCCHAIDWSLVIVVVMCLFLKLCCFKSPGDFDVGKI